MRIISIDCINYTAEQIIILFFDIYPELKNNKRKRKHIYIGVTNDIAMSVREHNIALDSIIFYAQTPTLLTAFKVEKLANDLGFKTGNIEQNINRTNNCSTYIYAYVIDRFKRENTLE